MKKDFMHNVCLTIHGHFYQPPRENPWLEAIEEQPSAAPFHNWNDRINFECYQPNSVARIIDNSSKIIDIVNNYSLLSFNFGPTLLSWLEQNSLTTYNKILEADRISLSQRSGHGNALAQVYNHIIMPLANYRDKVTQVHWGINDFKYRFGRLPEGIWLSETAVDDETLEVLLEHNIKFTVLSPYQAESVKYDEHSGWMDASTGNIDPSMPYRYFLKNHPEKYIDIFFYDGSLSRSIAFEHLLTNGEILINRLKDGYVNSRHHTQLIHVATDGESYGHHTKFGDMSLAFALKIKCENDKINLTNYGEFLEKYPPTAEVKIKEASSWSCFHGVGRWKEDCGCSTGAQADWNQKWRDPLRKALDWLNAKLADLFEREGSKYFVDVWNARNNYINVLINRNSNTISDFIKQNTTHKLSNTELVYSLKLLEMQKNAMFMFTSCGWFFADISGIETTQILRYAARAMQLASDFGETELEEKFVKILAEAESNIKNFGNGQEIYDKFVKPSIVSRKQIVAHWAISSLFESYNCESDVYSYKIKKDEYIREKRGYSTLVIGRIELLSKVTTETNEMIFCLLHFGGEDFHCVIKGFAGIVEYKKIKEDLIKKFSGSPLTEVVRSIDEHFGREYFTLKDLFIDKKRDIFKELIKEKLDEFSTMYYKIYDDSRASIIQLIELGLPVPSEFKIAAKYTLSRKFNKSVEKITTINDIHQYAEVVNILKEAELIGLSINKEPSEIKFTNYLENYMQELMKSVTIDNCLKIVNLFETAEYLKISLKLPDTQNLYFENILLKLPEMIENLSKSDNYKQDKDLIAELLRLGEKLNFNLDKQYALLSKNLLTTAKKRESIQKSARHV